jgi:hypothetical protein
MKNAVVVAFLRARYWIKPGIRDVIGGFSAFFAITLVFFLVADLSERLRAVDKTLGWWVSRQAQRIIP